MKRCACLGAGLTDAKVVSVGTVQPALTALLAAVGFTLGPPAPATRGAPGFALRTVVSRAPHPTALAFDRAGRLWFTSAVYGADRAAGVWTVRRGRAVQVIRRLNTALGLLWRRGVLYVSHIVPYDSDGPFTGRVTAFSGWNGHRFARRRVVVDGLPVGEHTVDSLVAGPGGRIYLGVGSQTDHRRTGRRLSAAVISFRPDGRGVRVEGRGLRNPYGLTFVPGTSSLLIAEHGRDDLRPTVAARRSTRSTSSGRLSTSAGRAATDGAWAPAAAPSLPPPSFLRTPLRATSP